MAWSFRTATLPWPEPLAEGAAYAAQFDVPVELVRAAIPEATSYALEAARWGALNWLPITS